ncbi:MAG: D-alanine--D-alanine ligase, partial [Myxococcaceae bacterium]
LGCRDVARIDFRMDEKGRVYFLECNPLPGLTPDWSDLVLIAKGEGMDYRALIGEIMDPAIRRYREHEARRRGEQTLPKNGQSEEKPPSTGAGGSVDGQAVRVEAKA